MLPENEVRDRAIFCCCVFLQLSWLHANHKVSPGAYADVLERSSLDLGQDPFIRSTLEEAAMMGDPEAGLRGLIHLYEGFVHALCEVLETQPKQLAGEISIEFLRQLAGEVGMEEIDPQAAVSRL